MFMNVDGFCMLKKAALMINGNRKKYFSWEPKELFEGQNDDYVFLILNTKISWKRFIVNTECWIIKRRWISIGTNRIHLKVPFKHSINFISKWVFTWETMFFYKIYIFIVSDWTQPGGPSRYLTVWGLFFLCLFLGGFCKIAVGEGIIVGTYSLVLPQ